MVNGSERAESLPRSGVMVNGQRKGRWVSAVAALLLVVGVGVLGSGGPAGALPLSTTTGVISSLNPSTVGESVTFTATVTGSSPTGTVAFTGPGITGCDAQPLDGSDMATCTTTTIPVGNGQTITATYSGDGTNATSFGTVNQTVVAVSSTGVISSLNPSTVGESVTFTATVTGSSPTGTVAFTGPGITGCDAQPLDGSDMATCTTTTIPVGNGQTITATYSGDGTNATSFGTVSQSVNANQSATALISSLNPSHFGQSVTFTATVTGASPTGTVNFSGTGITGCGAQALNGSGVATCTTTTIPVGSETVTAGYSGDANNAVSSNTLSQTVDAATSGTALVSSQNPSIVGESVTFTATVTGSTPTGTVAFTGTGITGCGTQPLSGGQATCTTTTLPVGAAQTITATYSGDANNVTSFGTVSQTVNAVTSGTTLQSSVNPSTVGQSVTFTATVTGSAPTGTVNFETGSVTITGCGTQPLVEWHGDLHDLEPPGRDADHRSRLQRGWKQRGQWQRALPDGEHRHHRDRPRLLGQPVDRRRLGHLYGDGVAGARWRNGRLL